MNRRAFTAGLGGGLVLSGTAPAARGATAGDPARVFAAASLRNVFEAAADQAAREGRPRPILSFAASSLLAKQIEAGAPADLFASADEAWMDVLQRAGRLAPGTRRILASGRLVLIAPKDSRARVDLSAPDAAAALRRALGEGRLSMAGPEVPAGLYGDAALKAIGADEMVRSRIARADNVRAALDFVARGEAPLGIVYETDARIEPAVRIVSTFPEGDHPRILYPAALIVHARPEAAAFLGLLSSATGRGLFVRFGFGPP